MTEWGSTSNAFDRSKKILAVSIPQSKYCTYQKNRTPAHAVNYYRTFLCERVFDPSDHKQHKFDSFTFTESATWSQYS